jgi:predicted Zn-dependent protease
VRPESSEGWLLGAQAQRTTSHPDALRLLDEGIAAHPRDVELLLARADLLVEGAEADLATEDWRARVRDDLDAAAPGTVQRPALQRTHTLLRARIALIEGDPRRAGSVLDTLLERNANDIYTVRLRARAAAAAGDRRAAVLWWQRLLTLAPDDSEATRNLSER